MHKTEKQDAARHFDQETRRAIRHYRRVAMQLYDRPYDVQAVRNLKECQRAYHTQQRDELALERTRINALFKDCVNERTGLAFDGLTQQRRLQYEQLVARQREHKAELREAQVERTRHETLGQTRDDWRKARTELAEASREKKDKQVEQEARRREAVEHNLAERPKAIQRDRGGGGREL